MAKPVLIVEDSEDDALFCKLVLQKVVTNQMLTVRDGTQAVAYLTGEGKFSDRNKYPLPEVLLIDLKMPKIDGFGLLEWLRTQPNLKPLVVVLTHSGLSKDIARAYVLGAQTFLTKPLRTEDVVHLVAHFREYWDAKPAALAATGQSGTMPARQTGRPGSGRFLRAGSLGIIRRTDGPPDCVVPEEIPDGAPARIVKFGTEKCDIEFGGRLYRVCTDCVREIVPA